MKPTFSPLNEEERLDMNKYLGADGSWTHCKIGDPIEKRSRNLDILLEKFKENNPDIWRKITSMEKSLLLTMIEEAKHSGYIRMELIHILLQPPKSKQRLDMQSGQSIVFEVPPRFRNRND